MLLRGPGAELCVWMVTVWSPGITGWTIYRISTPSRLVLCCFRCFHSGLTPLISCRCQHDRAGLRLPHLTPCATLESGGINVSAQSLPLNHNICVFSPFILIAPLLKYVFKSEIFMVLLPLSFPTWSLGVSGGRSWSHSLLTSSIRHALLGRKNDSSVLWFPSEGGQEWSSRNVQYDSNPVAHSLVKDYLKFISEEQAGLAITPSQAVPLFFRKFQRLIAFLRGFSRSVY